jgi:predicted phosphodiesterase
MKFLCIGDTHFKTNNIEESYDFIFKLEQYLKNNDKNIDYIVALGDILDKHEIVHTQALNVALDFFKLIAKYKPYKSYVLIGNHDFINNNNFLTNNHWMNSIKEWKTINIIDNVVKLNLKDDFVAFLPYVPDGRFVEALNTLDCDWKKSRIIFGHQLLNGCKMGAIVAQDVEEWLGEYPLLVSGHIHDKQTIKDNLYYTGSSMQHAYGESSDKTLTIIDSTDLSISEIDLGLATKRIIYVDASEIESKLDKIIIKPNESIKLVVSGDEEFFKEYKKTEQLKKKLEDKGISKIVFKQNNKQKKFEGKSEKINNDFLLLLDYIVKEKDNDMVTSFYEHIIYDKEDKSDTSNMLIL